VLPSALYKCQSPFDGVGAQLRAAVLVEDPLVVVRARSSHIAGVSVGHPEVSEHPEARPTIERPGLAALESADSMR